MSDTYDNISYMYSAEEKKQSMIITKIKNPMDMFGLDNVHEQPKMSNYLSLTLFTKK